MSLFFRQSWGRAEGNRNRRIGMCHWGINGKYRLRVSPQGNDALGPRVLQLMISHLFLKLVHHAVGLALEHEMKGVYTRYLGKPNSPGLGVRWRRGCSGPAVWRSCLGSQAV